MNIERKITVLYGSQTGTAQEMAERLWRKVKICGFSGPISSMDDYDVGALIKEFFVIFVCSTTGDGEEPDNMKKFWKFLLRKGLPADSLKRLNFAVLGLGDSTYSKFNFPAKKLHKRLLQLGGTRLVDIGLCDYQHDLGHDSIAEPWAKKLFEEIKCHFPHVDLERVDNDSNIFFPRYEMSRSSKPIPDPATLESNLYYSTKDPDRPFYLTLKNNTRTTAVTHFQDVRLIELISDEDHIADYQPGDVLYVRPKNSKEAVERFFKLFENHKLNLQPTDNIEILKRYEDLRVPSIFSKPVFLQQVVEQYWDLSAIPKKYAFSILAHVSEDKTEKEKCIEFCTPEGQEELFNYCNRPRRTILEVLEDFHHSASKLTMDSLFELFTSIKPRAFSIASSCKASTNKQIDLLVAVVKYYTKLKNERLGLCSNYLKNLQFGDKVYGWVKRGTFIFPTDKTTPLIMIGPGTGLAPFRSLIMEREFLQETNKDLYMLIFGCRNENGDFHCKDYIKKMEADKQITLLCAFSRDQEEKIYVQHKIVEHSEQIWNWIKIRQATICIAGNSKDMPQGVKDSIIDNVFCKHGVLNKSDAEEALKNLEASGKLQLETW